MTLMDGPAPRLYAVPLGADFPEALADGLLARARAAALPPEALARVTVWLGTEAMRARVAAALAARGPLLLPRLRLVGEIGAEAPALGLPPPVPALQRRLELAAAVGRLLDRAPDLAPRAALFDLAESLGLLLDEMQAEGVAPAAVATLDVAAHAAHWARAQAFLAALTPWCDAAAAPDAARRQRLAVQAVAEAWAAAPPADPVIVAGTTGSRGPTLALMRAVARLPQGALVLPGFDAAMPAEAWAALAAPGAAEDHPQARFQRLAAALGVDPAAVRPWAGEPPVPARAALVSLALRPAPVTDQWRAAGAALEAGTLAQAVEGLTLVEAATPRAEAEAIALILREAAGAGRTAALFTPDRALARQVTAALDRWHLVPDDSAGRPLGQSAPGRLLRHAADLVTRRLTAEALLALLKHPLVAAGEGRGAHLRLTLALERALRAKGPPFPDPLALRTHARAIGAAEDWAGWLAALAGGPEPAGSLRPLAGRVAEHRALAERLVQGAGGSDALALWQGPAGEAAQALLAALAEAAPAGGDLTAADYATLVAGLLSATEWREPGRGHPLIRIRGPRDIRAGAAEVTVLGGLNEGTWPALPPPDPWLNRAMRAAAGLPLPERRIGLSALDFQMGAGAAEVVLTRARRDAAAETVPARWLVRLTNLLAGLSPDALAAMRARGVARLARARALDAVAPVPRETRPAPRPPVAARPRTLAVTRLKTLIRDPYAIYAAEVLRLRPVDPLRAAADVRLRGDVLHRVLETWQRTHPGPGGDEVARLVAIAAAELAESVPWPAARALWQARLARVAPDLVAWLAREGGEPLLLETAGRLVIDPPGLALVGRPDRIDRLPDGTLHLIDYKTGAPPSARQQKTYDRQLPLLAVMAVGGAFAALGPGVTVARTTYLGVKAPLDPATLAVDAALLEAERAGVARLAAWMLDPGTGFAARRAMERLGDASDYDHLSRFGEWDAGQPAVPEDME
jgi:double-strand break repair protein AddB